MTSPRLRTEVALRSTPAARPVLRAGRGVIDAGWLSAPNSALAQPEHRACTGCSTRAHSGPTVMITWCSRDRDHRLLLLFRRFHRRSLHSRRERVYVYKIERNVLGRAAVIGGLSLAMLGFGSAVAGANPPPPGPPGGPGPAPAQCAPFQPCPPPAPVPAPQPRPGGPWR